MSVSGILSSALSNYQPQNVQSNRQQFKQEFQQLGQDLQSGNLSAAQADFATLQQNAPQAAASTSQSNNPIAQAFNQLSQDLQSGNLTAAQQDFSAIQQDFQNQAAPQAPAATHHHHHHESQDSGQQQQNPISQLFAVLGQALQSGDLPTAQLAYSSLQQDLQNSTGAGNLASTTPAQPNASGFQTTA